MTRAAIITPVGWVQAEAEDDIVVRIAILEDQPPVDAPVGPLLREALAQLEAFFDARLERFDLPLGSAATPRGEALRQAIDAIAFGALESYGAIAQRCGSSARAVGQACARNPLPIIVPCHRVVGAGGALGHYSAGGGLATKRWLIQHETRGRFSWAT